MLKHCVFVNFKSQYSAKQRASILAGFADIAKDVAGMLDFAFGPNLDFEAKSSEYSEGFIITFSDRPAHLEYENHPLHISQAKKMVAMCQGGAEGIIVFDLEVEAT